MLSGGCGFESRGSLGGQTLPVVMYEQAPSLSLFEATGTQSYWLTMALLAPMEGREKSFPQMAKILFLASEEV